jgi:hypothetical protein
MSQYEIVIVIIRRPTFFVEKRQTIEVGFD